MIDYRMKELAEIINDLTIMTKIKCVLYDASFRPIYHYEKEKCAFCAAIRSNKKYLDRCLASDLEGLKKCTESGGACMYKCHMGLSELLTPIKSDGVVIGFILVGQSICDEDYLAVKKNIEKFPDKSLHGVLYRELEHVRSLSIDELRAMERLTQICSSYIDMKKLIKRREEPTKKLIEEYIAENLRYEIGIESLTRTFRMSRSSLYSFSKKNFGMGISEYISSVRMDAARDMLLTTDMTVSEISYAVGIYDTNYFIKQFKAKWGLPPKKWKNSQK
ncbi:MAG: PocR ligand-binding domain-containing protein [Clostridia bacterium]|nr:PocR ligand-binding domain-containing protein [Clostridia bacterium]